MLARNVHIEMEHDKKTKPRYLGPFEVDRQTKGGSYILKELDGHIKQQGYAVFRLLLYITQHDKQILEMLTLEGPDDDDDDDMFI